jgi:hypothetical protein
MEYYADGDSVTFKLRTRDLDGAMVNVDGASITIKKCNSTAERDWAGAVAVSPAVESQSFSNFATGVYRYNWSTTDDHAGRYVAEATVIRGAVTNKERILVVLR